MCHFKSLDNKFGKRNRFGYKEKKTAYNFVNISNAKE